MKDFDKRLDVLVEILRDKYEVKKVCNVDPDKEVYNDSFDGIMVFLKEDKSWTIYGDSLRYLIEFCELPLHEMPKYMVVTGFVYKEGATLSQNMGKWFSVQLRTEIANIRLRKG